VLTEEVFRNEIVDFGPGVKFHLWLEVALRLPVPYLDCPGVQVKNLLAGSQLESA
jgi:hypothetical protein